MLKYLTHSEIDFTRWDNCVRRSAEHQIYAYAGYLNVSTANSWHAIVEMQDEAYFSVFPLPVKKRFGEAYVYQPLHSQQLGLFTTPASQYQSVADYLERIPRKIRKVYLQLNTGNTFNLGALPRGFSAVPRVTYCLELNKNYEELRENYSKNLLRSQKKAIKEGYDISTSQNLSDLIELYRETKGRELTDVKDRHYLLFEKQYEFLRQNQLAQLLEIRENGELIAGVLFLTFQGKLVYLFSASSETGKKNGAMAYLIDHMIRQNAGTETVLDFEGSVIPSLARFFGSFGAKPVTYLSVSRNNLPWFLQWVIK